MKDRTIARYLSVIGLLLVITSGWYIYPFAIHPEPDSPPTGFPIVPGDSITATPQAVLTSAPAQFDGQRAYADVLTQVAFGARIPGSEGHAKVLAWMRAELEAAGWQTEIQESEAMGHPIQNIVARRGDAAPQTILGAHYDSRMFADHDPDPANHNKPVPGANDGASGVAVLLELARVLPEDTVPVWLVFFDAEDNGRVEGWDWILGSREFVRLNPVQPRAVVIVDMIGDAGLNIYKERNSDRGLTNEIWETARTLGHEEIFIPDYKYSILDDHTPFLEAGIPAVDIIDFDYPYWHTVDDTPDKISALSLQVVGETLQTWVMGQSPQP